jgi:alpha-glucan phosphorylase-like protein
MVEQIKDSKKNLKRIFIKSDLPEALAPLREMAQNLWWSWHKEAAELFAALQPQNWVAANYNPIEVLDNLDLDRAKELAEDKSFIKKLNRVQKAFEAYMKEDKQVGSPTIAYFSMEYGLHISTRLYSGGLGILAGDYLKEASDQNANLYAVGLLYRYGYFQQAISLHGDQISEYPPQKFTSLPLKPVRDANGEWMKITINLLGRTVYAKIWCLQVGRVPLYLLDTDIDENEWEDRQLTHHLYGGDNEHRLKQEILLGVGGIRALEAIRYQADIYHCNEGHAAFMTLERVRNLIQRERLDFDQAREVVRASSLFTTHTPVPAGHDYFPEDLLRNYLYGYTHELGINWDQFMSLGKKDRHDGHELFSMSHLAIRLCQEVNGVSQLHGTVSQEMFNVLYPGYNHKELHIGYVTNGVHYPTWIANEWHQILAKAKGEKFIKLQSDPKQWNAVNELPGEKVHEIRTTLKERLLHYVREKIRADLTRRGDQPSTIFQVLNGINDKALVVGFARRFATYKRAHLLFRNLERLSRLVNDPDHPIMFIFAGKAHPADHPGQQLIKDIVHISKRPEFAGKIIFLEGYNMEMAKFLVQGVDIWLNTPTRPKEASGTSGMKAAMNGVMNFSVLDGWWAEGYREDSGWALPLERTYDDQNLQDDLDAETLYNTFETDIVPTYFNRNEQGFSEEWVTYVKNVITKVGPHFTMKRMLDDYYQRFYEKMAKRSAHLNVDGYRVAKEMVNWKRHLQHKWEAIHVIERDVFDTDNYSLKLGQEMKSRIRLYLDDIQPDHVGIELVFFKRIDDNHLKLIRVEPLRTTSRDDQTATYESTISLDISGVFEYGYRLFPKHPNMAHRQDLGLVKWI